MHLLNFAILMLVQRGESVCLRIGVIASDLRVLAVAKVGERAALSHQRVRQRSACAHRTRREEVMNADAAALGAFLVQIGASRRFWSQPRL
jgi:hypothetical protein